MDPVQANLSAQRLRQAYGVSAPVPARSGVGSAVTATKQDALVVGGESERRLQADQSSGVVGQAQTAKVDHAVYGSDHSCPYC